jgi:hypothetical protein
MTLDMFKFEKPSISLPDIDLGNSGSSEPATNQTLYRFQDENGVWHFTDQRPVQERAEQVEISDINLMEAPPPPSAIVEEEQDISVNPLSAITRGAEVMEDAQAVQEMLDTRLEDMDQSLNDIR